MSIGSIEQYYRSFTNDPSNILIDKLKVKIVYITSLLHHGGTEVREETRRVGLPQGMQTYHTVPIRYVGEKTHNLNAPTEFGLFQIMQACPYLGTMPATAKQAASDNQAVCCACTCSQSKWRS